MLKLWEQHMPSTFNKVMSQPSLNPVCKCGQGYASAFDGKCGQYGCRNKREREAHKRWYRTQ